MELKICIREEEAMLIVVNTHLKGWCGKGLDVPVVITMMNWEKLMDRRVHLNGE